MLLDHLALLEQDAFYLPEPSDKRAVRAANLTPDNKQKISQLMTKMSEVVT